MRQEKSPTPSDPVEVVYALILIVVLMYILAMTSGCVSFEKESGTEPIWKPHTFLFSPSPDGRCAFVDRTGFVLDCDDPRRPPGSQSEVDEVPVEPFTRNWEEI
jgi:hypothetical protein